MNHVTARLIPPLDNLSVITARDCFEGHAGLKEVSDYRPRMEEMTAPGF